MPEPTPQSNLNKMTRIEGEINTFKATVKGSLEVAGAAADSMKESVDRMEKRQTDFFNKHDDRTRRIHKRIEIVEDNVATVNTLTEVNKAQLEGHEKLCEDRVSNQKDSRTETSGWVKWGVVLFFSLVASVATHLAH